MEKELTYQYIIVYSTSRLRTYLRTNTYYLHLHTLTSYHSLILYVAYYSTSCKKIPDIVRKQAKSSKTRIRIRQSILSFFIFFRYFTIYTSTGYKMIQTAAANRQIVQYLEKMYVLEIHSYVNPLFPNVHPFCYTLSVYLRL